MSGYQTPLAKMRAKQPAKAKPGGSNVLSDILSSYLNRQKMLAQGGLDQANLGAQQLQNANPMGAANMVLGPLGYLASPVTALVPTDEEINASPDVPEWLKPGVRAVSKTGMTMLPVPGSNELGASAANLAKTGVNRGVDVAAGAGDILGRYIGAPAEAYMSGPGIRKPLGTGLGDLMANATPAEQAALKARLEAEAAQNVGAATPAKPLGGVAQKKLK